MTESANIDQVPRPRVFLLLPVAVAMHIAEEWFGGFTEWARVIAGVEIGTDRFIIINLIGFVLFTAGALLAYREPRAAWIGVAFTSLFCLNAILHTGLSAAFGVYSPGTITGLLLYIPLSVIIFRWAVANLSRGAFAGAILFGIGIHALATISAMA